MSLCDKQITYEEKKERLVNSLSRNYEPSNLQAVQNPSILGSNENISDVIREIVLRDDVIEELESIRDVRQETTENIQETSEGRVPGSLREEMLEELERLRCIMNGENESDEGLYNNLTAEEKVILDKFIKFFSICPVCNQKNHRDYLRRFYFDTNVEKIRLRERLLELMEDASEFDDIYYNKIVLGIPCCDCFKTIF